MNLPTLFKSILLLALSLPALHADDNHKHPRNEVKPHLRLWMKLDTNGDGKLSPEELAAASAVLTSMDANKDGTLAYEEAGLDPKGRSFAEEAHKRRHEEEKRKRKHHDDDDDDDDDDHNKNEKDNTMSATGNKGGSSSASPASPQVKQWMGFDKNGDGKLTSDEVPQRMAASLLQADTDKDGAITQAELEAHLAKQP